MIQFAALPSAALPVLPELHSEQGMESTISIDFAALLAMQGEVASPAPAAGENALALPQARTFAASGNMGGKPGGKLLPLAAMPGTPLPQDGAAAELPMPEVLQDDTEAEPASPPANYQPAPLSLLALALQQATPLADPSPPQGQSPKRSTLEQTGAAPAVSSPRIADAKVQVPAANPLMASQGPGRIAANPAATSATISAGAPALTSSAAPVTAIFLVEPVIAEAAGSGLKAALHIAPAETGLPTPLANSEAAPLRIVLPQPSLALEPARAAGAAILPRGAKRDAAASEALPALPTSDAGSAEPGAVPDERMQAPSIEAPAAPKVSFTQPAQAAAPTFAATVPAQRETPADFSTLVDRLVAAREAAQASLTPNAVHAAITHAEFGQVSLRFEQQDGALSVSLASADPDFARSALAAASPSQAGVDNSDNRGSAGRQDNAQTQLQPQGQSQGQAQSQASGQSPQRGQPVQPQSGPSARHATDTASPDNAAQPPRRGGIFA